MSFRFRLIIVISVVIALAFAIGGAVLISASFQTSLKEETTAALDVFASAEDTLWLLNTLTEQTDYGAIADTLSQLVKQSATEFEAAVLKAGDAVLFSQEAEKIPQERLPLPTEGQFAYTRVSDAYGYGLLVQNTLYVEENALTFAARFDLTSVYKNRQTQMRLFLTIYFIVVLSGILIAMLLAVALTRRLKRLTDAVQRISDGDLSIRSGISTKDEFGQLSRDFDTMADKLQDNIRQLEEELNRREAFMGAFAHEIKTPMTSIIGYADLLRQDSLDGQTRLLAADYVYSEGQRLEKLSFQLLKLLLLNKDAPQFTEVSLQGFLSEIERLLTPRRNMQGISFACCGEAGKACFEPNLVKSLLYNLVDNAVKAIDGAGSITVTGTPISGGCRFVVKDTGRGMEPEELSRITEAFYRVDKARSRRQGGAGLGLTLCKEIVALHHGSMAFASTPNVGTEVTVLLYGGKENA